IPVIKNTPKSFKSKRFSARMCTSSFRRWHKYVKVYPWPTGFRPEGVSRMARAAPLLILAAFAAAAQAQDAPTMALRLSPQLSSDVPHVAIAPAQTQPQFSSASQPNAVDAAARIGLGEYRIGPEDLIEIQVFGVDQLARTVRV